MSVGLRERVAPDESLSTPSAQFAVIIPHYNDLARLRRCLDALFASDAPSDATVTVVDNRSDDDVAVALTPYPHVRLVVESARGAAAARNRGVAVTDAPVLVFLDADCIPSPDWWTAIRASVDAADVVGGRVDVFCETPGTRSGAEAFETLFAFNQARYISQLRFTVTANMLTRRDVFEQVGGFRTGLSEDLEWCQRATGRGYRIAFAPNMVVAHPSRSDWGTLRTKWLRLTSESFQLHTVNGKNRLAWAVRGLAVLGSPLRDMLTVVRTDKLSGAAERRAALATLFAIRTRRSVWMLKQAAGLPIR